MFRLQFPKTRIEYWACRYPAHEDDRVAEVGERVRTDGYLDHSGFLKLCKWKSPRPQRKWASNAPALVEEATRLALAAKDERLKIGILRVLDGVDWPTASVILHFCDRQPYPVLDYRALWSLGIKKPPTYKFEFWWSYTTFVRRLAAETSHTMRTIDRALWQYSKEKGDGA